MSLINQMLQDLDARRADVPDAGMHGQHIRPVPQRRDVHIAWLLALVLALALAGVLAWLLLHPGAPPRRTNQPSQLPLKLDLKLGPTPPAIDVAGTGRPAAAPAVPRPEPQIRHDEPARISPVEAERLNAAPLPEPVAPLAVPTSDRHQQQAKAASDAPSHGLTADLPAASERQTAKALPPAKPLLAPARATPSPAIHKKMTVLTPQQRAENDYRNAIDLLQQGKATEAVAGLEQALQLDPQHLGAREALIGIFLDQKRHEDAARLAREGLRLDIRQAELAMILARLQLEKGELHPALETLQQSLPYASGNADYQAFLAALLQRDGQSSQAVNHYLLALRLAPQNSVWWMGLGISLQADQRIPEAQQAFRRAKATGGLSAALLAFVNRRLSDLKQ